MHQGLPTRNALSGEGPLTPSASASDVKLCADPGMSGMLMRAS